MKKLYKPVIVFLTACLLVMFNANGQSIHQHTIKNAAGDEVALSQFSGRKLLVITLSGREADTALLSQLLLFQNKYADKVTIVGVGDVEDGYNGAGKIWLKEQITAKNISLVLREGMQVKKSSGTNQSPFMNWLTDRNANKHFDQEVKGAGQKFFLDEAGGLYAVMGPEISLQATFIDRIMSKPAAK